MAQLEIIHPGLQTLVQDLGRFGLRAQGVPVSGVTVPDHAKMANALVGNPLDAAILEFRLMGPTIKALDTPLKIAVCAPVDIELTRNNEHTTLSPWRSFTLLPGDQIKISALKNGVTGVIAIGGELDIPRVLNSRSSYLRSNIGHQALRAGERLTVHQKTPPPTLDQIIDVPATTGTDLIIRLVRGPQADYFPPSAFERLLSETFHISQASDRMGARLDGPTLLHLPEKGSDIASDGVVPGSMQVPGNGQPIVLFNDGQTVGGYPKIATVISSDLPLIANAAPRYSVRFEFVDAQEACLIARQKNQDLQHLIANIKKVSNHGFVDMNALYENNLISGVVDMRYTQEEIE